MKRFRTGQSVTIVGDKGTRTLDPIPDGEVCSICDDFGQSYVNVFRPNGQLRAVARACVAA